MLSSGMLLSEMRMLSFGMECCHLGLYVNVSTFYCLFQFYLTLNITQNKKFTITVSGFTPPLLFFEDKYINGD